MRILKIFKIKVLLWLGLIVFFTFTILLIAFLGVIYISYDKDAQKVIAEQEFAGTNFGKTTDQASCLQEGLKQSKEITMFTYDSLVKKLALTQFEKRCLKTSRPTTDFCKGISKSLLDPGGFDWAVEQCHKAKLNETKAACQAVFDAQRDFCVNKGS